MNVSATLVKESMTLQFECLHKIIVVVMPSSGD